MKFKTREVAAIVAVASGTGLAMPVWADAGGVVGGLMAGMVVSNIAQERRADAYNSGYRDAQPARTVVVQQPAASPSAESRLREVDDMHKKGLISSQQAAAKKQAILNDM